MQHKWDDGMDSAYKYAFLRRAVIPFILVLAVTFGARMISHLSTSIWRLPSWPNEIASRTPQIAGDIFPRASGAAEEIEWNVCGEGLQCTSIDVPLDYHNSSDGRTISIAVNRIPATNTTNRKGAVFFNPGGPGGTGTGFINIIGTPFFELLQGQYDIVGFDPRGVNQTKPYVSCFDSLLQQVIFSQTYNPALNLPASASALDSASVKKDLSQQISFINASIYSLAQGCYKHTGEPIDYMGTETVVRDIDVISQKIYGKSEPINFWGFSYGTVIGQYMVKILPAKRLGKIVLDGVVNVDVWSDYGSSTLQQGFQDTDKVFDIFASSCIKVGQDCSLNAHYAFKDSNDLISRIDSAIDSLYSTPVLGSSFGQPMIANASNLRALVTSAMSTPALWPTLASVLSDVLQGNVSSLLALTTQQAGSQLANLPDSSVFAGNVITCADTKPYSTQHPAPSLSQLVDIVLEALSTYSRRSADQGWSLGLCDAWDKMGLYPRKTYYNGSFELAQNTLSTPVLIVSNNLDPVTPLKNAELAANNFGNNAKLVQQLDGTGHTSLSQASYCTGRIINAYFTNGTVPSNRTTLCNVDQKPFESFDGSSASSAMDLAWAEIAQMVQAIL